MWSELLGGGGLLLQAFGMAKGSSANRALMRAQKESAKGQAKIKRKQADMMIEGAQYDRTTAGFNLQLMDINDQWADYFLEWDLSQLDNTRQQVADETSKQIDDLRGESRRQQAQLVAKMASGGSLGSMSYEAVMIDAGVQTNKAVAELRYQGWNQQAELLAQRGLLWLKGQYEDGVRAFERAVYERDADQNYKTAYEQAALVREEADLVEKTGIASAQAQAQIGRAQSLANFGSLALNTYQMGNTYGWFGGGTQTNTTTGT